MLKLIKKIRTDCHYCSIMSKVNLEYKSVKPAINCLDFGIFYVNEMNIAYPRGFALLLRGEFATQIHETSS